MRTTRGGTKSEQAVVVERTQTREVEIGMLKAYEMMLIFDAGSDAAALDAILKRVDAEIQRAGGAVESTRMLGRRMFARTLKKRDEGQYVTMRANLEPTRMDDLKMRLKLNTDIFRMQILRGGDPIAPVRAPRPASADHEVGADGQL